MDESGVDMKVRGEREVVSISLESEPSMGGLEEI
jgi:hypothetical protein